MGRYRSNGGEVADITWAEVGPLTDRTKAEDRMESGIFAGLKSSEYILIGEAITVRRIQRRLVSEKRANLEEITSAPHGTDLDKNKRRQFDPWKSGRNHELVRPMEEWT